MDGDRCSVALRLFFAQQSSPSELSESFLTHAASFCGLRHSLLKLLIRSISAPSQLAGEALAATSAQSIKGADDRWESLLGEVLRGASRTDPAAAVATALGEDADSEKVKSTAKAFALVGRWRRVLYAAVNAMMPTVALLRFGIDGGAHNKEIGNTVQKALSFLSCVAAYSCNDEAARMACGAATGHLPECNESFA